ncbi:hypothetical protein Cylst_4109 [Cylindrospermum stagnale PCC 7417]|uniref:Uncharacterized protein n=1 Tax=Cylindrospermum stagnale PCC 7417 TaxID=56107 RepID=K9X0S6_9NOST|nr:hypothetical protein [Cylindrospermum stagnale]AFZ26215.1 hypothetical protein Cylst_4109 [Cylindrospermum stagnale PCC 7417]
MIINRQIGVVADWWFENRQCLVFPNNLSELFQLLQMCQLVIEVLQVHQLLEPQQVIFSGWLNYDQDSNTLVKIEEPTETISIDHRGFLACCGEKLDQLGQKRSFLYPIDIYILGMGIVLDAKGNPEKQPDVIWLGGKTLDAHIVNVCTQSDAWLPYNLLAEPQLEVSKLNAPRLESALKEIQDKLGIIPVTDTYSDYAIIDGFHLSNHIDIDGEVIKTHHV